MASRAARARCAFVLKRDRPDDRAAGVRSPVRSEQAGECGHEGHAAGVVDLRGEGLGLGRVVDDAELVAQPLDGRPGDRDRALQCVHGRFVAEAVAERGDQTALGPHDLRSGVEHQEVAGAVRVLEAAWLEADLTDEGRVLVAEVARDGNLGAERTVGPGRPVDLGARPDLGQHRARHAEQAEQLVVPLSVSRSISIVRLALVTSVRCSPVSCHNTHVSMVPNRACPASASARTPSTFSRIQRSLPPAK